MDLPVRIPSHTNSSLGLIPYLDALAGKTVNLKLRSADNTTLGAWFMLSDRFYRGLPFPPAAPQDNIIPEAIRSRPTILFLHGNTGTRALPLRITVYTGLTSRLDSNVLAIDYRGFGDSEGHPSVHGVSLDAHAGWNYLIDQGARPEDIVIVGHSLGTAVAGLLAAQLGREGVRPRGVVLLSVRTLPPSGLCFLLTVRTSRFRRSGHL